jgi:rhomboid family GlyGly-CTERM serine protease
MTMHITQPAAHLGRHVIHDKWRFCLVVTLLALAASCWPDGLAHLRYDRSNLINGEIWRMVSAHLVHLNLPHLLLNLLGLVLICELIWGELPLQHGFGLSGFSAVAISAAFWWLHPELVWYAGLSGVLHGLWAGCTLFGLWRTMTAPLRSRLPYLAGALLLAGKLLMEFHYGPSESTAHFIGGEVVSAAHLYGALAGAVYVLVWGCARMRSLPRGALQQQ